MRSQKRYTDVYFKKRVDHEEGHAPKVKPKEPAYCESCGAIYVDRRWTTPEQAEDSNKHPHFRPAKPVLCPACVQIKEGIPSGFLYIYGSFIRTHFEDIRRLVENEATRAAVNNPLCRIMRWVEEEDRWIVETTTEHLAQRLGRALHSAYEGAVKYDFSHENKLARVTWVRDE